MTTPDTKPTSLNEILNRDYHCGHCGWDMQLSDATVKELRAAIAAYYEGLIPEKRKLVEPVTKRPVDYVGAKVGIDLDADTKGSLMFIQDNGFNMAIDTIKHNFTSQTDNEREDSRI